LNRWKDYFCQVSNVHEINDVRQAEIHTAEPFLPEPSSFEIEIAIEKVKKYTDQIPAELIQAGDNKLCSEFHKLIISIQNYNFTCCFAWSLHQAKNTD
jgi:hypothetical protein